MKNFLDYYHDELFFLRQKGGEFAKNHPEIAGKLDIKNGESTDPQTERIIESVAFMSAKLNQKIDDNAQDIAFHLLSALYPNLINTFPSCGIIKFEPDGPISASSIVQIKRGTNLFIKSKNDAEYQFKTLYPLNIYPISISKINLSKTFSKLGGSDGRCIEINVLTNSVPLEQICPNDLLFHISSEIIENALLIYEAIFSNANRKVFLKIDKEYIDVDRENIIQCGFDNEDSICPIPKYSTNSFQLFQEMLHFKKKFMFFRILGVGDLIVKSRKKNISEFSIIIDVSTSDEQLIQVIKDDSLALNTTPVVNLFPITSDPFRFDATKTKYLLLADQSKRKSIEIHSISEMYIINDQTREDALIQPYFSLAINSDTNVMHDLYWLYSKKPSQYENFDKSDIYISFVDTKMNPKNVYADVVYAKTLCTNRFELRDIDTFSKIYVDSVETAGYSAKLISKISQPISFLENSTSLWNLISQLAATHISLSTSQNILGILKQLAEIFSSGTQLKVDELFGGMESISTKEVVRRIGNDAWRGFVKGMEMTISISENQTFFKYFLGTIINQYLSDIVSINSFVELKMKSTNSEKLLAFWAPTSGRKNLI
ncbi:MAG: type VI secretion system baseplate subunit TssF [Holosporales bacterium]|nr:type VI secretion system baseplate subunit TssF [Holosporales bacterium]